MPTIPTTALDTSLASLAASTTEIVIGCKTATSGLHCDSPSWRESTSWDGIRKAGPAVFDITVGDKIKFVYSYDHNVWWLPDRAAYDACSFYSGGSELPHWLLRDADGKATGSLIYEAVVTEPGTPYLACELGQHCDDGQKIVVNVAAPADGVAAAAVAAADPAVAAAASPSPASPPRTPRPPPPPCPPDDDAASRRPPRRPPGSPTTRMQRPGRRGPARWRPPSCLCSRAGCAMKFCAARRH